MALVNVTVGHLEALLALEEQGSFTRAGQVLGRTQSAVSRSIATLERQLGGAVVDRTGPRVCLSSFGRKVAEHARAVSEHLAAIEALRQQPPPAAMRVGAVASAMVQLVPDAVAALQRDWPGCDVLTVQGDDDELFSWLQTKTVDLAITSSATNGEPTSRSTEITDEFLAVLPADHALCRYDRVPLAELIAAGVADPGGTCGPRLAAGFAEHGVAWTPAHVVRDVHTVVAMARAGITAGIVPALALPRPRSASVTVRQLKPALYRSLFVHNPTCHELGAALEHLITSTHSPAR